MDKYTAPDKPVSDGRLKKKTEAQDRDALLRRAKSRALYLLGDMARTKKQMQEKLSKNYPPDIVDEVIRYLMSLHYIDDRAYAESYIRSKSLSKSHRMIRGELLQKGVEKNVVDEVLQMFSEDSQEDLIRRLIEKRKVNVATASREEIQKLCRYLLGKGFSYEEIRQATGRIREEFEE